MGPEELARYRLKRVLGRGGRAGLIGGEVWEAEDTEHPRRVALKILRIDDEEMLSTQSHFVREAQALGELRHPNVVGFRDSGESGGTSFVVMELVEGEHVTSAQGDVPQRLRWMREIASGLAAMHAIDVVHRDVKAENVIIRADGSACLVDLGVPFVATAGGDPPDALDDQAAWASLARAVLGEDVPEDVTRVLDRAGAPDRDSRFSSMRDVVAALAGPAEAVEPEAPEPGKSRPARTLSPWIAVLALGVLIALAVIVQRLLLD